MQANINRFTYRLAAGILAVIAVLIAFRFFELTPARADEEKYSWVMDDLQKDPEFDHSAYPANATDRSLKVIQIAESADGELFVYVYRPSAEASTEYKATSINISKGINENLYFVNYKLRLVSNCGTLDKYVVENFTVSGASLRYYEIASIYRKWIANIDEDSGSDNIVNEVAFEVGRRYTVATVNGDVSYECSDIEVVKIEDKWNSAIIYPDGYKDLSEFDACTSHFVAFSTDRQIDALLEADVTFEKKPYTARVDTYDYAAHGNNANFTYTYGEQKTVRITLYYDDVIQNDGSGYKGEKHVWNRIETVETFKANNDLNDNAIKQLENMQWVLRYYESARIAETNNVGFEIVLNDELTTDVTILRLEFETDGVLYNLGVVDNKQTGTTIANANKDFFGNNSASTIFKLVLLVLGLVAVVVVIVLTFPFLQPVYTAIANGIVWLFTAPVKAISAAAKKRKDKKSKSNKKDKKK